MNSFSVSKPTTFQFFFEQYKNNNIYLVFRQVVNKNQHDDSIST